MNAAPKSARNPGYIVSLLLDLTTREARSALHPGLLTSEDSRDTDLVRAPRARAVDAEPRPAAEGRAGLYRPVVAEVEPRRRSSTIQVACACSTARSRAIPRTQPRPRVNQSPFVSDQNSSMETDQTVIGRRCDATGGRRGCIVRPRAARIARTKPASCCSRDL
jgi:hypothetical protein